jgi:hypothetical protein
MSRAKPLVWPLLLGCLALFYANEIWRSSKSAHAPTPQARAEHAQYEAKHDNIFSDAWNWTTQDPVSFYTSVLAIFTGALVFVAGIQIRYLIRADITARRSAIAARRAAVAARKSADHIPRVERAYLFLSAELKHRQMPNAIPDTGDVVEVQFAFKNHGKTPAIITKIEAEVRTVTVLPTELRERAIEMPPGLVIGSGETTPYFPARNLIVPDDLPKIRRRERMILFVGAVEYLDIFGSPHKTGFCLDRDPVGTGFGPSPTTILNYYT